MLARLLRHTAVNSGQPPLAAMQLGSHALLHGEWLVPVCAMKLQERLSQWHGIMSPRNSSSACCSMCNNDRQSDFSMHAELVTESTMMPRVPRCWT